jgi:hypothetical protein
VVLLLIYFVRAGLTDLHIREQPPGHRLLAKHQLPDKVAKEIGAKVARDMKGNKGLWADGQQEPGGLQIDPHTKVSQLKAWLYSALGHRAAKTGLKHIKKLTAMPGKPPASKKQKQKQNAVGDPAARKALCYFLAAITSGTV